MERLEGDKLNFDRLAAILGGIRNEGGLKREPLRCGLSTDDLKRLLVAIGNAKCAPDKFVVDEDNKFAYENIFKWCIGDDSLKAINPFTGEVENGSLTKGIYICGPTGTGKTMCLNIYRTFLDKIGAMITIPQRGRYMIAWTTYFAGDLSQNCQEYGNVTWTNDYPVLCIQDMGSEVQTINHFGTKSNAVEQIIQMRGEQRYLTMITSNYKIQGSPYGSRIESRLSQMCNYYEMKGKDRRKLK